MKSVLFQKGEKNRMNNRGNDSENLVKNIAKVLENIEIDDIYVQQSIDDIKNISNQLKKNETSCEIRDFKNNKG